MYGRHAHDIDVQEASGATHPSCRVLSTRGVDGDSKIVAELRSRSPLRLIFVKVPTQSPLKKLCAATGVVINVKASSATDRAKRPISPSLRAPIYHCRLTSTQPFASRYGRSSQFNPDGPPSTASSVKEVRMLSSHRSDARNSWPSTRTHDISRRSERPVVSSPGDRHRPPYPAHPWTRLLRRHLDDDRGSPERAIHVSCADTCRIRGHATDRWTAQLFVAS